MLLKNWSCAKWIAYQSIGALMGKFPLPIQSPGPVPLFPPTSDTDI